FTGDKSYMDKWAAYADDWAMNQHEGMAATNIADVPDQWINGVETMLDMLRYLGGVAALPNGAADLPAPTFGRVFSRLVDDYIPVSILYHRSNPQNWNDASLPAMVDVGFFMEDYPIGRQLVQEARRRVDLLASTHHLPDGTEMDTTIGYSNLYIIGAGTMLNRIDTRQSVIPEWMLTKWEKEDWRFNPEIGHWEQTIHAEMLKRARTLVAHSLGSGEWPIGGTRNGRSNDSQRLYNVLHYFLPDAFQNPDIANIMAISTGRRPDGMPSFTSERLPYGGHAYIRDGWGAKDPYLYMYAAPYPLSGSLSVRNNNAIGLGAYGYDLIETGENGVYDRPHTPVKVDGLDQDYPFGVLAWGHRGQMLTTSGYTSPPNWRWHASSQFNVAEGVYAGNFGQEKKLDDVSHQRMVQYVRGAGFWIVTDRLKSPQAHNYTLDWRFGVKPGHESDFTADQISFQAASSTIKTARPGGANVSLYEFPSSPLAMTSGEERTPPEGYRLHDFVRVSNDWKAQGESVVVTAIYPRKTQEEELTSIKALNGTGAEGFDAMTPAGAHVMYQAATVAPAALKVGDMSANGESLLVTTGADGVRRGVALGC
ncbi:MAG: heparinase, partial [Spirosoma sp.]|nr:heparinase [Spirosoma sp.]